MRTDQQLNSHCIPNVQADRRQPEHACALLNAAGGGTHASISLLEKKKRVTELLVLEIVIT
jgi:hypothetical protein